MLGETFLECSMNVAVPTGLSLKVMGTIASQLKALSQNTPQSSIII